MLRIYGISGIAALELNRLQPMISVLIKEDNFFTVERHISNFYVIALE